MAVQQRPFAIPESDDITTIALVPKGTQVIVTDSIRPRPRARAVLIAAGTYKIAYVMLTTTPTVNGGVEAAQYVLLDGTAWPVPVPGDHKFLLTADRESIYFEDIHPDDNKPWGWYGLDWLYDPDSEEADEDGYVRLRRMVKPVRQAAFIVN